MDKKVRDLTVTSLLAALIWFLTFTPLGFTVPFFGISMTFVHIPVIIGTLAAGLECGTALGGMFGLASLVKNLMSPTSIYSYMLQNPLVSVAPRLLIAPAIFYARKGLLKLFPNIDYNLLTGICAVTGAVTNTVCTLTAFSLAAYINPGYGANTLAIWALSANCPIECVSAAVVSIAVMAALNKVYRRGAHI